MDNKKKDTEKLLLEIQKLQKENLDLVKRLEHTETSMQTSLSAISHELRNTLTLLVGSAQFLEQDYPEIVSDKSWKNLWSDLLHMQTFLMELASFRSIQKISLSKRLCDLNTVLRDICRDCQPLFDGVHKHLIFLCPKAPVVLFADRQKLSHVFTNLIKNGMEALESEGTVSLRIRESSKKESHLTETPDTVAVEVRDTGIGLSKEQQKKIFEPFYTEKSGGTGLGLSIAQTIVKAHSGFISVSSTPGKGTIFTVLLPKFPDTYETS